MDSRIALIAKVLSLGQIATASIVVGNYGKRDFLAVSLTTSTRNCRRASDIIDPAFAMPFRYLAIATGVVGVSTINSGIAVLISSLEVYELPLALGYN